MEEIYKKYSKQLYRYLYSLSGNHELSEELMQETFYSAIKNINSFRGECSMYSWLCKIAKNKKIKTIQFDDIISNQLIDANLEDDILSSNDIHNEIQKLDNITREVVLLRINGDLPFKKIGEILNKSEVWARTTFYRAKLKLKERLKNEKRM